MSLANCLHDPALDPDQNCKEKIQDSQGDKDYSLTRTGLFMADDYFIAGNKHSWDDAQ